MKRAALILAIAALAVGCGDSKDNPLIPPAGLPANSTPAGAMARLEAAFEGQNRAAYRGMFTADFSFRFSEQSDPVLAASYGTSWGPADEDTAAFHLFDGFTSAEPPFDTFPQASEILLTYVGTQILNDLLEPDSTAYYRYAVVPRVDMQITVAQSPEPLVYTIDAPHHFHLVRGDAAVLAPDQPADSLHWYIRRWDDRSPAPSGAVRTRLQNAMPARSASWGSIKSMYRR